MLLEVFKISLLKSSVNLVMEVQIHVMNTTPIKVIAAKIKNKIIIPLEMWLK
jgi:hypothetical protein